MSRPVDGRDQNKQFVVNVNQAKSWFGDQRLEYWGFGGGCITCAGDLSALASAITPGGTEGLPTFGSSNVIQRFSINHSLRDATNSARIKRTQTSTIAMWLLENDGEAFEGMDHSSVAIMHWLHERT